ncbi:conserved hypothetical protein [Hyella patelloides LEGE 07179]|uniref:Uncharacterized protein n=2 Tax=Hyella TaxID=945733 RepID=A0A563W2E6_9CYAN|nr:conserved hypothetical protein [Hyella patelloides LEGE 07179]
MKNSIISTLSALIVSSLVTPVLANEVITINRANAIKIERITPFNLVHGSYQGRFTNQGIPSNLSLLSKIHSHRIQAEDLVQAAIASGRLAKDTLNDAQYLNSVEWLLNQLDRN